MAIKSGNYLGTFTNASGSTWPVEAIAFGNNPQLYVAQKVTVGGKVGYVIRSRSFVLSTASLFTQASGIVDADVTAAFQASTEGDAGGFNPPAGFTTPDGWAKLFDKDGTPYYIKNGTQANDDTSGDGIIERSGNYVNQAWDWVKANPVAAVAIALAIAYLIHEYTQRNKKRKKKFLGVL